MPASVPHLADPLPALREERADLAAAFRWAARLDLHEAVANHFSLAVDEGGRRFLMNADAQHFATIRASDLLLLDADDPATMDRPGAPDRTAWGLHATLHRRVPHARCVMHAHPPFSTVLASLADSRLPPIDQNAAAFFGRVVIDEGYGGLALEDEGERIAAQMQDPEKLVMVMGNHGVMVLGANVADAFDRLYYFERAAATYVRALQTGRPLRVLGDAVAERTASQIAAYPGGADRHLVQLRAILDGEGSDYAR